MSSTETAAIAAGTLALTIGEKRYSVRSRDGYDLSIPLQFDGAQPRFFGAAPAHGETLVAGSFVGDVRRGGSCNCSTYSMTPHCNGTHTECVGHVTADRISIRDVARETFIPAQLLSVTPLAVELTRESSIPAAQGGDTLITREALQHAAQSHDMRGCRALVIRTLPNEPEKQGRNYDAQPPAYFSAEAMKWIVAQGIDHLVVDLPSIDRAADAGHLTAHRLFWGMPPKVTDAAHATRAHATVTELAYIDNAIADGLYVLNLQVAPFSADAAPSRPFLLKVVPQ